MTPLRTRAIDAIVERYGLRRRGPVRVAPAEAVDALLAAGLLHDPDSVVAPVPWREPRFPRVQGTCPACGAHSLFLGKGGYVTCAILTCDDPCRASDILLASPPPAVRTVTTTNTQTVVPPRDAEARIERAARDLLMDALGAIYDLGGCDGTCGTTGACVAKRIRAYLADDQEDTDAG